MSKNKPKLIVDRTTGKWVTFVNGLGDAKREGERSRCRICKGAKRLNRQRRIEAWANGKWDYNHVPLCPEHRKPAKRRFGSLITRRRWKESLRAAKNIGK